MHDLIEVLGALALVAFGFIGWPWLVVWLAAKTRLGSPPRHDDQ